MVMRAYWMIGAGRPVRGSISGQAIRETGAAQGLNGANASIRRAVCHGYGTWRARFMVMVETTATRAIATREAIIGLTAMFDRSKRESKF